MTSITNQSFKTRGLVIKKNVNKTLALKMPHGSYVSNHPKNYREECMGLLSSHVHLRWRVSRNYVRITIKFNDTLASAFGFIWIPITWILSDITPKFLIVVTFMICQYGVFLCKGSWLNVWAMRVPSLS